MWWGLADGARLLRFEGFSGWMGEPGRQPNFSLETCVPFLVVPILRRHCLHGFPLVLWRFAPPSAKGQQCHGLSCPQQPKA